MKIDSHQDQSLELGTASVVTLGSGGFAPEKETTMLGGAITDD